MIIIAGQSAGLTDCASDTKQLIELYQDDKNSDKAEDTKKDNKEYLVSTVYLVIRDSSAIPLFLPHILIELNPFIQSRVTPPDIMR
ncbi:MAG: hypothetical protein EOO04_14145 [Chitinophagaceae bacterium]|nr:MAG: hypothetical protein EOO04_14145 [Chitinophagaceae bacterium]